MKSQFLSSRAPRREISGTIERFLAALEDDKTEGFSSFAKSSSLHPAADSCSGAGSNSAGSYSGGHKGWGVSKGCDTLVPKRRRCDLGRTPLPGKNERYFVRSTSCSAVQAACRCQLTKKQEATKPLPYHDLVRVATNCEPSTVFSAPYSCSALRFNCSNWGSQKILISAPIAWTCLR